VARRSDPDQAIYIISVAAELAGVHPQTLRVYERKGLLRPQRTEGNTRRYSERDIELLRTIQELTNEGINLAGVMRILQLEGEVEDLRRQNERLARHVEELSGQLAEFMDAPNHVALVPLKDVRRIRRALKSEIVERASQRRTFTAPPIT